MRSSSLHSKGRLKSKRGRTGRTGRTRRFEWEKKKQNQMERSRNEEKRRVGTCQTSGSTIHSFFPFEMFKPVYSVLSSLQWHSSRVASLCDSWKLLQARREREFHPNVRLPNVMLLAGSMWWINSATLILTGNKDEKNWYFPKSTTVMRCSLWSLQYLFFLFISFHLSPLSRTPVVESCNIFLSLSLSLPLDLTPSSKMRVY